MGEYSNAWIDMRHDNALYSARMSGRVIVPVDTQIDQIRDHCEQHRLVWMFVPNADFHAAS